MSGRGVNGKQRMPNAGNFLQRWAERGADANATRTGITAESPTRAARPERETERGNSQRRTYEEMQKGKSTAEHNDGNLPAGSGGARPKKNESPTEHDTPLSCFGAYTSLKKQAER